MDRGFCKIGRPSPGITPVRYHLPWQAFSLLIFNKKTPTFKKMRVYKIGRPSPGITPVRYHLPWQA